MLQRVLAFHTKFEIYIKNKIMNIIKSIWNYKCPRCRKGDVYIKPLNIKHPLKMHSRCNCCDLNFHPEPGYYYGAMFISYIWTGFLCLFITGSLIIGLDWSVNGAMSMLIFIMAIMYLFVLRESRIMYLHLDVKYDKSKIKSNN